MGLGIVIGAGMGPEPETPTPPRRQSLPAKLNTKRHIQRHAMPRISGKSDIGNATLPEPLRDTSGLARAQNPMNPSVSQVRRQNIAHPNGGIGGKFLRAATGAR